MRIGKMQRSKLKEEFKVPKTRGSVQLRSTEEHKPWKSRLKTQKTKNLRSVPRRNHVEEKHKFDLVYDRKAEKERQEKERQRNQTSPEEALQTLEEVLQIAEEQLQTSEDLPTVVEVPAPPSGDEGSMSRSSMRFSMISCTSSSNECE